MKDEQQAIIKLILSQAAAAGFIYFADVIFADRLSKIAFIVLTAILIILYFLTITWGPFRGNKERDKLVFDDALDRGGKAMLELIQSARDESLRYLPAMERYTPPDKYIKGTAAPDPLLDQNRALIRGMLESMVEIFSEVAPKGTKLWASLRDRRCDDKYHTFERAGLYSKDRESTSVPLHKDTSNIVSRLKMSYRSGRCVVLTGISDNTGTWEGSHNDVYKENRSVLLGAVMTKSKSGDITSNEWKNYRLTWIIAINADRENAFNHNHIHLMRCCVVGFSWFANILARFGEAAETPRENED